MRAIGIVTAMGVALGAAPFAYGQTAPAAAAAAPPPATTALPYGAPVSLEQARRIVAGAEAEARKNGFHMAFAVVEPDGTLVYFERMDGTQYGSVDVAQAKARTAARFKRPSKAFFDSVMSGRVATLSLDGVVAIEGGIPIIVDGRIIGAVGASGGSSDQDGAMAGAGLAGFKP